jgi:hypothetical protein
MKTLEKPLHDYPVHPKIDDGSSSVKFAVWPRRSAAFSAAAGIRSIEA